MRFTHTTLEAFEAAWRRRAASRETQSEGFCAQRTTSAPTREARVKTVHRISELPPRAAGARAEVRKGCGSRQDGASGARLRAHHCQRRRLDGRDAAWTGAAH